MKRNWINIEFGVIKTDKASPEHRELEQIVKSTFESIICVTSFPRTQITITIQELNDEGYFLSTCINAITLALVDAGIPLKSLIVATSAIILDSEDSNGILINYTKDQEETARSKFVMAFTRSFDGIVTCYTTGSFSQSEYWKVTESLKEPSQEILTIFREALAEKYNNM